MWFHYNKQSSVLSLCLKQNATMLMVLFIYLAYFFTQEKNDLLVLNFIYYMKGIVTLNSTKVLLAHLHNHGSE